MEQDLILKVIGLMSGTSKDEIDIALIETDGITSIEDIAASSLSYLDEERLLLNSAEYAVNKTEGDIDKADQNFLNLFEDFANELNLTRDQSSNLKTYIESKGYEFSVSGIEYLSTALHIEAVKKILKESDLPASEIDLVAYHGQTVFHKPAIKKTVQLGCGKTLAESTGIRTVFDFRSADVAAGGQGAPFAPLYHQAIAKRDNLVPCVVLNIGGISNLSIVYSSDGLCAFDTGPGNCLIDAYTNKYLNEACDFNGKFGSKGTVNEDLLIKLAGKCISIDPNYISKALPKSLDVRDCLIPPEIEELNSADACATLEALTAYTIVESLNILELDQIPKAWIISGGGRKNPVIMSELKQRLKTKLGDSLRLKDADTVSWNGDALEAQIFAYLAVRVLKSLPLSLPGTTGVPEPLTGGRVVEVS